MPSATTAALAVVLACAAAQASLSAPVARRHTSNSGSPARHRPAGNKTRIVIGGSQTWGASSPIVGYFQGFPEGRVKVISAAGTNPVADGASIVATMLSAGIIAEWIPVHSTNCDERTRDEAFVQMVDNADAIYMSGGQSGRLQSCMYGAFAPSGADGAGVTPFLQAMLDTGVVGGSSAGAMNQPTAEILVTGSSAESYAAVAGGSVFQRDQVAIGH